MKSTEEENTTIKNMEISDCLSLLSSNYIGRLAYISGKTPHINPITYFHDAEKKCILSYSAPGFKIEAMGKHALVAFQVDEIESIQKWAFGTYTGQVRGAGGKHRQEISPPVCRGGTEHHFQKRRKDPKIHK